MKSRTTLAAFVLATVGLVNVSTAALPDPGVTIVPGRTALLITDPQNDFLSAKGVTWGVVGSRITTTRPITAGSSKVHSKP
jgi:hypothetical protein